MHLPALIGFSLAYLLLILFPSCNTAIVKSQANREDLVALLRVAKELSGVERVKRDGYERESFEESLGSLEGGSSGVVDARIQNILLFDLIQAIIAALSAAAAPAPTTAAPAAVPNSGGSGLPPVPQVNSDPAPKPPPGQSSQLLSQLLPYLISNMNIMGPGGHGDREDQDDDPSAPSLKPYSQPNIFCDLVQICNGNEHFDAIASFSEKGLLAYRGNLIYRLSDDGDIFLTQKPQKVQQVFPGFSGENVTAALVLNGFIFMFHDNKCTRYPMNGLPLKPQKSRPIYDYFPGVPLPITAAWAQDNDTVIFVSRKRFVAYRPNQTPHLINPPSMDALPRPNTIKNAFTTEQGQRFIVTGDTLLEISPTFSVLKTTPFRSVISRSLAAGWLKCPLNMPDC